ncbi:MAG: DASS family sodium-coupled anion symporter [Bacteroidetes bacterium]|nr:DASS family sodium-coupled anion symporter [Bacteroidota bacterium]MBT5529951.1 DASS family sodium-coupled anion symporter [Cytophagia bacterium]MBT3422156.1 DASS family sodium-coupled anion symporter [Bacteroidota bacterium]MBT3800637.1 DASS family sodium-coupled anion symporter [Bacteroidota bacterium]MBT3932650.1 DASS family sodium-coupled anion symporter [Bacteroidota bacterium]
MRNYHLNKLPQRERSKFEKILLIAGAPLAIIVFVFLNYFADLSFLHNIDPSTLSDKARTVYDAIGSEAFTSTNISMLAIFLAAIILWITEAIPNYLTSLILIIALVLTNVLSEVDAYHQLGHKVMWLNILSFVLASMLVKTGVAKRFALWFIIKFGKNASSIFVSFIVINLILSAFISATTAKAAILLPIFMVIAAVYGATGGKDKNNFGRNLVLQNLLQINMGAGAFVTGSGANLLAAALIGGAIGSDIFFTDWMIVAFPISLALMIIGLFVGTKFIFPIKKEERVPQIKGGMEKLKDELSKMGKVSFEEVRSVAIFVAVLALWTTDKYHGISPTAVAFLGAVVSLLPKIGVVKWNEVDIPWHLLLFSAGAYTLGAGFKVTDLPSISVNAVFDGLGFNNSTPFGVLYLILTFTMLFSALIFQSKTMRTLIFVPIAIGVAQKFGYPVLSLAFPVALLIEHVYVLPFNSKPALLLYSTDQYSWSDTFKYGITMMGITWILFMILGETWLRFLGYTPNGIFGFF